MLYKRITLSLFFCIFFEVADAGLHSFTNPGIAFIQVPPGQGLSQSSVYCMLQDHKGFIWVGTKDGLNRYDGYEFITYKYDQTDLNSLSNNEITCLEADNNKYLWIGTRSGGINKFNLASGKITRFNNLTYDELVRDLLVDSLNNLWAATSEGLLVFLPDKNLKRNMIRNVSETAKYFNEDGRIIDPGRENISITSIFEIRKGVLLVGGGEGLFIYEIKKNEFTSVSQQTFEATVFTSLTIDSDNSIWAASYDGLFKITSWKGDLKSVHVKLFNSAAPSERRLPVDWVEDITLDSAGNLWAGTRGAGLFRISGDRITGHFYNITGDQTSLPDDLINSIMIDRTGILWIGSESNGLAYSDLCSRGFHVIRPGRNDNNALSDNLVTAIAGNDSLIWVGTAAAGIDVFEQQQYQLRKLRNIPRVVIDGEQDTREVMALLCDADTDLWLGSATNSLTVFNINSGFKSYFVKGFVFSLFQDSRGRIWFGTWGQGLGYIDKETEEIESYNGTFAASLGLSNDKVLCIYQDSNNFLWVGTKGGGVNVCNIDDVVARKGEFTSYRNEAGKTESLSYNDVYDILEDAKGNIWIATGSGLNKIIPGQGKGLAESIENGTLSFVSYSEKDGLAGGLILFMEEDAYGNLWLGTNKGISRFNPDQETFTNFGVNEGLPSGEFHLNSSFRDSQTGTMYFGGVGGIAVFHPDSLKPNPFPAKVQITGIRLHNEPVSPGESINGKIILKNDIAYTDHLVLSYRNNEITFEFSALHFSNTANVKYAYRLKGFNDSWQETTSENRRSTYTNLREGRYVFEVKATNNDGAWCVDPCRLPLSIKPPIFRTYWAYTAYVVLLIFLLLAFRKYSLIGIKQKNSLIIESLEHKKDHELTEAKMKFFTNISHEIRTPLTLIYAPLQEILRQKGISPKVQQTLSVMHRNVRRLLNMVDQLLEFRKLDTGHLKVHPIRFNLTELCRDTLTAFDSLALQKGIETSFDADEKLLLTADEKMVSTGVYNLLSNAFKFTPTGGKITVQAGHVKGEESPKDACSDIFIKVSDTGPGIPEELLGHVFDRFSQLKGHDHLAGSGIGLSIVREFVELNQGSVWAYNNLEGGCCFEILLPEEVKVKDDKETIISHASKCDIIPTVIMPALETASGGGIDETVYSDNQEGKNMSNNQLSLCIVEDDVELALWLKTAFKNEYAVTVFHDGAKAISEIPSLMPDILVCDLMLPGLSGIEITDKIKSTLEISHILVVMLTARTGEDDVLESLQAGADSYITKPFNINILKAQVASLIQSRQAFKNNFSGKLSLEPTKEIITPIDEKFLSRLLEITEQKMSDPAFDVSVLVEEMYMSHSIILKKVKALTGLSLVEFIRSMRIKKAAQIFSQDKLSISEVSFMVGFSDPKYFSKCFSKQIGKKPTQFIKEHHL
jgi:signal transduction histidine kinase/ligand-binding sensor domain-containing protein/CheY-like chemotaxis protein